MNHCPVIGLLFLPLIAFLEAAQVTRGPSLQSATSTGMTICWRTDAATTSEIRIGLTENSLGAPVTIPGERTDHAVTLTGLQPATRYFYRVQGNPITGTPVNLGGPNHWFRTAGTPADTSLFRFWVVGDSGYGSIYPVNAYNAYMNVTTAAGKRTDAFLMLGDNAYDIGTDNQIQWWVFDRYATLLRNTPVWSAFGNHDGYTVPYPFTATTPYDTSFRFPTGGECGGFPSGTERYYSFNANNIHFICLDTHTPGNWDDVPGGTYGMVDWLLDDLKTCSADWIVAFMHLGPYSKGSHNSDTDLGMIQPRAHIVPLLELYGVDLVLYGHSHCYERSALIDGHYGNSSTFNAATMRKWPGNGSDFGGVDTSGSFVTGPSLAGGVYQKPAAMARAGAVYSVIGASSSNQNWANGSSALVNPSPHPIHVVSLSTIGDMVVETEGNRLNGRYLGETGSIRDDFTILKGATYTIQAAVPTIEGITAGIAFPVTRTGSTAFAEAVPIAVNMISGSGVTPAPGTATFAAGQSSALVKFFPPSVGATPRFEASVLPTMRAVQSGGAQRQAYRISGVAQTGQFASTPAATWYASRFGSEPVTPAVWDLDDDNDGLSLLLEYALGGEPGRNDTALLPQGKIEGASFIFRYTRPHGRSDLSYQVLTSSNLATWPMPGPPDLSDGPVSALGEPRKVSIPVGAPAGFLKLKVSLLP